jgi:hypothetical protein
MGKKAVIIIVLLLLVVAGAIWKIGANLDVIATDMIEEVGTDVLQARVDVASVAIDLKRGKATIHGLTVANPPGYSRSNLLEVDIVEVDLALNSLPSTAFHVQAVNILTPRIFYEGDATGGSNIQTLLDTMEEGSTDAARMPGDAGAKPPAEDDIKLIIDELVFTGGRVTATSVLKPGKVVEFELSDIHMKDIGREEGGVTTDAVAEMVVRKVLRRTVRAAAKSELNKLLEDKAREALGRLIGEG